MSIEVDLRRAPAARTVADIHADDVQPGDLEVRALEGTVWGYGYACAGCGSRSYLAISDNNPGPRWTVAAGDAAHPEGVTLSPSIHHSRERGGCGWHGYLRNGRFVPC